MGASGADRRLDRRAPAARRGSSAPWLRWIERLPPPATLVVFVVPVILLLPLKFLGVWMLAQATGWARSARWSLAKLMSLGVTAFIFDLTRESCCSWPGFGASTAG